MAFADTSREEGLDESAFVEQNALESESASDRKITSICLVGELRQDEMLADILRNRFGLTIYQSSNGVEFIKQRDMAFVLANFVGPDYNYLFHAGRRIFGPTIIFECAEANEPLPIKQRPIFCNSMNGITLCFAGFHEKKSLTRYVDLVHHMGGSVRRSFTVSVTHVVSNTTQSSKYRLAVGMGKKAMHVDWILKTWVKRMIPMSSALSPELIKYTLPPFYNLSLHFRGFSVSEEAHMSELVQQHGGTISDANTCTHFVIEPSIKFEELSETDRLLSCRFVTVEWFWVSIQLDICANEDMYGLPNAQKQRKATLRKNTMHLAVPQGRSHSGTPDSSAYLDMSSEMSSTLNEHMFSAEDIEVVNKAPQRGMSKRHQVAIEIEQTECRYVEILKTIITLYKEPLEGQDPTFAEPLLDATEIKLIFSNLPPIYQVHSKLSRDLSNIICHWSEDRCIGNVWLRHADEMTKAYSPYVNFFEKAKELLNECDGKKPRFHAFLKARQNRPDSNRESLQELLIRPVQRLPSVELLLRELLKHTEHSNPDYADLKKAVECLKTVLTYINEGKRKTEGQVKLFDIVNKIENCPPYLLASRRQYIGHVHVIAMSNSSFSKNGTELTLFLFNDCLEIAKRRSRTNNRESLSNEGQQLKHIDLLFLSNVRRVVDIVCFPDFVDFFCLTIRNNMGDTNYPFRMEGVKSADQKVTFLTQLCNQVIKTSCRLDMDMQRLENLTHCNDTELVFAVQKAVKNVRGGRRMSRAFSFSNTHKRLRRVVSQVATSVGGRLRRMSKSNVRLPLAELPEDFAPTLSQARHLDE